MCRGHPQLATSPTRRRPYLSTRRHRAVRRPAARARRPAPHRRCARQRRDRPTRRPRREGVRRARASGSPGPSTCCSATGAPSSSRSSPATSALRRWRDRGAGQAGAGAGARGDGRAPDRRPAARPATARVPSRPGRPRGAHRGRRRGRCPGPRGRAASRLVRRWHEQNPMLGLRGVRLLAAVPELVDRPGARAGRGHGVAAEPGPRPAARGDGAAGGRRPRADRRAACASAPRWTTSPPPRAWLACRSA